MPVRHRDDSYSKAESEWLIPLKIMMRLNTMTWRRVESIGMKDKGTLQFFVDWKPWVEEDFARVHLRATIAPAIVAELGGFNALSDNRGNFEDPMWSDDLTA